jgi:hypothetical protein
MAIHEAARRRLEGCTQGGDGVLENVEIYRKIGRVYAYRNARYEGVRRAGEASPSLELADAREVCFEGLAGLDRACFPAVRAGFLRAWIHQTDAFALARVRPGEPGVVDGYGVIRPCFRGWKIGPLFARDAAVAEALFCGLVGSIPCGEPYVLDIAEPNEAARTLVARHGLGEVFATARMYTGPFPEVRLDWVYGVTTFELG